MVPKHDKSEGRALRPPHLREAGGVRPGEAIGKEDDGEMSNHRMSNARAESVGLGNPPLISVIIPIYNVEQYLSECVHSVIRQTYQNLEIILVDDGSTDGSSILADKLGEEDSRIAVFHMPNGGPSVARNFGLTHSHGEWVSFIDSDDWVSPLFIQALYEAAVENDCKIAAVPGGHDFKDGSLCELTENFGSVALAVPLGSRDIQLLMLYQKLDTGPQWRLYARDVLGDDPFPIGLYYEDLASVYKFVHRAGTVALLDCRDLYAYRLRSTSLIRQAYRHVKGYSAVKIAEQLYADITEWYPDLATACSSRCFSVCRMVYGQVPIGKKASEQDIEDRRALWQVIVTNRNVVASDPDARRRERLAARIAQLGERPFATFCHLARSLGLMQ